MISKESIVTVADNSGAIKAKIIGIKKGSFCFSCGVGDFIKVSIQVANPIGKVKKGDVCDAIVIRTRYTIQRKNGNNVNFGDNAIVLLTPQRQMIGTDVSGYVAREIALLSNKDIQKIASLAEGVI